MTLANNNKFTCTDEVVIPIYYSAGDGTKAEAQSLRLRVLDSLTYDIVLGMDWLHEYNPTIIWMYYTVSLPLNSGKSLVLDSKAVEGSIRIDLRSICHAMRSVKSKNAVAWLGVVKGTSTSVSEVE